MSNNSNPNLILYDLSNQLRSEDGLVYTKGEKGEKVILVIKEKEDVWDYLGYLDH